MLELVNSRLRLLLLDPVDDRSRLGPRFCTGGYIYQVEDSLGRPLFGGPEYPAPNPSVINGQGMPDVFQFTLYQSPDQILPSKLIVGVGVVENRAGKLPTETHFDSSVETFVAWRTACEKNRIRMEASQEFGAWAFDLIREVVLHASGWDVITEVRSSGSADLPIRWFTHPFFPLNDDRRCCFLPPGTTIDHNPGFTLSDEGLLAMRPDFDWTAGCYTHLKLPPSDPLFSADIVHPVAQRIRMDLDMPPMKIALWANDRTFSPEPFVERLLTPGAGARWRVRYSLFPE